MFKDAFEAEQGAWTLPEEACVGEEFFVRDGEPILKFLKAETRERQEVLGHFIAGAACGGNISSGLRILWLDWFEPGAMVQVDAVEERQKAVVEDVEEIAKGVVAVTSLSLKKLGDPVRKWGRTTSEGVKVGDQLGGMSRVVRWEEGAEFARCEVEADVRAQLDRLLAGVGAERERR